MSVKRREKVKAKIVPSLKKEFSWKASALRLRIPGVSLSQTILEDRRESV